MNFKSVISFIFLALIVPAVSAQSDLQIKKKVSRSMPGMSGAMTAVGGMIPGIGGMIASTAGSVLMGQTMGKAAKAKDEFTFEYKVARLAEGTILAQASTKAKAKEDGQDVLTPQIKQASVAVRGEIAKRK